MANAAPAAADFNSPQGQLRINKDQLRAASLTTARAPQIGKEAPAAFELVPAAHFTNLPEKCKDSDNELGDDSSDVFHEARP